MEEVKSIPGGPYTLSSYVPTNNIVFTLKGRAILTITKDSITADPSVSVDDAAKTILAALEPYLKSLAASRIAELETALLPFAEYAAKREEMPMGGLGDSVHCIHGGTEHETEINMKHCRNALRALKQD